MSVFRPRSKIVSGMANAQAPFDRKGTSLGSRVGQAHRVTGAPRDELDPAITFYAQLQHSALDLGGAHDTFTRASDGLYLPYNGGDWQALGNDRDRYENGKLLMDPAITNKCANYNANPDATLTNVNPQGAIATRESNPADIAAAGLSNICSDGNVLQFVNSTGGLVSPFIDGVVGNTNPHVVSCWINTFGDDVTLKLSGDAGITVNSTSLQRFSYTATPLSNARVWQVQLTDGEKCQIALNQLEESPVVTSPIVTQGAAGQRAIDALSWAGAASFFNPAEGTLLFTWQPGFTIDAQSSSQRQGLVSVNGGQPDILYQQRSPATEYRIVSTNGVRFPLVLLSPQPAAGDTIDCAVTWTTVGDLYQVGVRHKGVWTWATPTAFIDPFPVDGFLRIAGIDLNLPMNNSNLAIYNKALTTAEVEALYP